MRLSLLDDSRWPERRGPILVQVGLATFGILALELALIRWMSGQVRILAYFNNLILIGSFLGMGTGLILGRRIPGLVHLTLPALAALALPLASAETLGLVRMRFPDVAVHLWGGEMAAANALEFLKAIGVVVGLFSGVVLVFLFAGAGVGHLMSVRPDLRSYSADLAGSLLGVALTSLVTAVGAPPPVWLLLGGIPFLWLSRRALAWIGLGLAVLLGQASVRGAVFSAYNRIDLTRDEAMGLVLNVNRDFHQYMLDLSGPSTAPWRDNMRRMYDLPFALAPERRRALVVGAGTGNDVQGALRQGFHEIYSVDIDGKIIALGRRLHPERPYASARVRPIVNDGRAFFEQYDGPPFDVVAFGFVDSHAMYSALSTLRLDNYLYTEEGLRAAWRLVAPKGHLALNLSFMGGPWMLERLYWTLADATGTRPVIVQHGTYVGAAMLIAARELERLRLDLVPFPLVTFEKRAESVLTTSDDWPFLYLRPGIVPWGYLSVLSVVLLLAFGLVTAASGRRAVSREFDWTLFMMGVGFLLLETRGVTTLSLLFGSTWVVNAVVFGGVLATALVANLAVERFAWRSPSPAFALLVVSLIALWVTDVSTLNRLPLLARGVAGGVLIGLPIGFAGIVVSMLLARSGNLAGALGANLLGAVVGGCLEYLSMYSGLRALALMALGFYLAAILIDRRRRRAAAAAPAMMTGAATSCG